ncbi:hypothetical protein [Nocardia sp. alder85J]|uniref:hypothetical protein n=1 Tax=Nocardia sp. alder85J TaxID=2862949 RepID=UPI001CD338DD|nr:hypothetical protein [Nocardia sp. alder85J]MCX4097567.1 hypothetical protein [Nocardia sp. alder85J]
MDSGDSARFARARMGRLLDFPVAIGSMAGLVVFGAAGLTAIHDRAWLPAVLSGLLAIPCALVVLVNIVVETAGYLAGWLAAAVVVLALPLLPVPAVRRWVGRIMQQHNVFGCAEPDRPIGYGPGIRPPYR